MRLQMLYARIRRERAKDRSTGYFDAFDDLVHLATERNYAFVAHRTALGEDFDVEIVGLSKFFHVLAAFADDRAAVDLMDEKSNFRGQLFVSFVQRDLVGFVATSTIERRETRGVRERWNDLVESIEALLLLAAQDEDAFGRGAVGYLDDGAWMISAKLLNR